MRERLKQLLSRFFNIGDSYTFNLTRVKTAFDVGTIGLDDFEEYTEDDVANLADRLLDNGVIVPPVKVGQTVWSIAEGFNHVLEGKIYEYTVRGDGMAYIRFTRHGYFTGSAMDDAIGKTVFLTREAAEEALKARENECTEE